MLVETLSMPLDIATANMTQYGSYPIAVTFTDNDCSPVNGDSEPMQAAYSAAFDPNDGVKRHAACDECRMLITLLC